jgi:hypothetical protein
MYTSLIRILTLLNFLVRRNNLSVAYLLPGYGLEPHIYFDGRMCGVVNERRSILEEIFNTYSQRKYNAKDLHFDQIARSNHTMELAEFVCMLQANPFTSPLYRAFIFILGNLYRAFIYKRLHHVTSRVRVHAPGNDSRSLLPL